MFYFSATKLTMVNYPELQASTLPARPPKGVVRFVHTADNHLRVSASGSLARGQDFFEAAKNVIKIASDRGAAAILNAGDMLNSPENLPEVIRQLACIDTELQEHDLTMYVVQGNHDFARPSWISVQEMQPRSKPGCNAGIKLLDGTITVKGIKILGLPFLTPGDLKESIKDADLDTHILMWHGAVLEFAKFPTDGIITCDDLASGPWNTVLLGDIHVCQYLNVGSKVIGYPGATELCKRDEPLTHTCTVMDFDAKTGRCVGLELVPVLHRPVLTLHVGSEEELADAIMKANQERTKNPKFLLLAKYVNTIPEVRHRLQQAAGSAAIVRAEAYPATTMKAGAVALQETPAGPIAYLGAFVSSSSDLFRLAQQLCDPDAPANDLLREYANT